MRQTKTIDRASTTLRSSTLDGRFTAQLLAGPLASDPVSVVERLLAVQAQDPRGMRLAVRARTSGLSAAAVDQALTVDRSLVVGWLNRGTLHLVTREDYHWLHTLTTPPIFTANARRLAQEGLRPKDVDRGVSAIERSLTEEGPLTRAQLGERIAAVGVRTAGQALIHLLMQASLRGIAVRGPIVGNQHCYALVHDWLGKPAPIEPERALAELARRYLLGHGPADDRDLAKWAGLPLRDARAGLRAIASELTTNADGLVDLAARKPSTELPQPRLLGPFDPLLMGWKSREWILGGWAPLVANGGMIRSIALVRGHATATWKIDAGQVELEPFESLTRRDALALAADGEDLTRYLASPTH